jgi:hypothetical protein
VCPVGWYNCRMEFLRRTAVVSVAIPWIAHGAELRNRDITPANSATVLTPILL